MKKVLFALPVLALALFLAFCAKEPTLPTAPELKAEPAASDREGGKACDVTINATGTVRVCGLSTNGLFCPDCYGTNRPGRDVGTSFAYSVTPVYPDVPFSITNLTNDPIQVQVGTSAYGCGTWNLAAGECLQFGLATTCLLFSTRPASYPC